MGDTRRAVLLADICEAGALHEAVVRQLAALEAQATASGGTVAKSLGDGIVCHFADADSAFRAACAMQAAAVEPAIKIGFIYGSVTANGGDVLRDMVTLCARLAGIANPRQVLTTQETVDALSPGLRIRCRDLRAMKVKGRGGEAMVCEVLWQGDGEANVTATLTKEMLDAALAKVWMLKLSYGGNTFTVERGGSMRLGRDKTNDVVVESSLASRLHALIYERDGHFVLADQSSNGTFLRNDGHMNEITLRREEVMLGERGWIGLGRPTVTHGDHMLRYRLERVRAESTAAPSKTD
jgi:adenylate cyclase